MAAEAEECHRAGVRQRNGVRVLSMELHRAAEVEECHSVGAAEAEEPHGAGIVNIEFHRVAEAEEHHGVGIASVECCGVVEVRWRRGGGAGQEP